jgi:hypothetical protein
MYDFEELNKNPGKAPKTVNPAKKFFYRRMYRDIEADGPIERTVLHRSVNEWTAPFPKVMVNKRLRTQDAQVRSFC